MDKEKTIKTFMQTLLIAAAPATVTSCTPSAPEPAPTKMEAPADNSDELNFETKGKAVCGIRG